MKKTFLASFRQSIPILIGWLPVGIAYGLLMQNAGYNALWTGGCSLFVFAGSLQFLMVSFFTGALPLITVAVMALLLNSRHIFYGLPFLEKWRKYGSWRMLLIFTLSDEAFSLHCARKPEEGVNEKWAAIFTACLLPLYWTGLSMLGVAVGSIVPFDMTGVDFAMTALFVVILVEQLRGAKNKLPALAALISSVVCLLIFGSGNFILPALGITVMTLVLLRKWIEPKEVAQNAD